MKLWVDGNQLEQDFQSPVVPREGEHVSLASADPAEIRPGTDEVKMHTYVVERVDHSFAPNGVFSDVVIHLTEVL